ncbi:MAG: glycosyl hydrolase-related protein [Oscillospiraceae bacterium]|jgi:alpha-mannosidase|nr:glycosyl hydrolase-related protein [Oscillospiraceae bacterium]
MDTNYWGSRIETQLRYLREVSAANDGSLDGLLDELAARLARILEAEGAVTKQAALELERAMQPASALCKAVTVSCVAHAHIDMNWMWRYDETAMLTVDTFRTMLRLMEEYPAFTFAQSQASVYKIVEECAPEMLPEIRRRVREGRWEVTASHWVEADKNMPSGESLTRHLLYTKRYLKELLGLDDSQFEIDYEPDTFGHGANVPEILASGGVKYMYHCRGYDGHHLYRWRAPSGAQVTVYRDPRWYNETIDGDSFLYVPGFCAKNGLRRLVHVYGVGDHGGGATRRDIERILDYDTWPCMPKLGFGRYIDFFEYTQALDLPVVDHELNFVFDGCYTSQSRIKKANRAAEAALSEAEFYNAMSHQLGAYPYDAPGYGKLWENVLFNHFHDILPGSGTIDTREYALGLFQRAMAGAGTRKSAALRALAARIGTAALLPAGAPPKDSIAEGAGAGAWLDAGDNSFNYTACAAVGGKKRLFVLYNPAQAEANAVSTLTVWDWDGDSARLKITDEAGRALEHELVDDRPRNFWGHTYFRVHVDCGIPAFGWRTVLLEETDERGSGCVPNGPRTDAPEEYVLENAHVRAVFDPRRAALVSFTDKAGGREYVGGCGGSFRYIEEDTSRGMSSWRVGRHMSDAPVAAARMSGVSGTLARKFTFEATVRNSRLKVTVSLDRNARHLRYSASCDWREFGDKNACIPQLAFRVPLAGACETFSCDNAFGVIERAPLDGDAPGQSFAHAGGLMLSGDSKYGLRCFGNALAMTLIRGSYDPDPAPEIYLHTFHVNVGIVPDAAPRSLVEAAQLQTRGAIAVAAGSQGGELPLTGSFARVAGGEAVVSSVKMAEDGDGMVVRLYSVSGEDSDVTLEFLRPVKAMAYVDAHENELAGVEGGKIHCKARGVAAVKIKF